MSGYTSTVDATPLFVPGSFDGQDVRLATVGNAQPGLAASGDFAVTQRAAGANMSVDIAAGRAYVTPGTVARQGSYVAWYGSTYNTLSDGGYTWTSADPSNPRIDLLCIEVADTDFGGSYTGWKWRVVDGTANAGATAANLRAYWPSIPSGCLPVAAIRIPAAATTITTANIFNLNTIGGPLVSARGGVQAFGGTGTILADGGRIVTFSGAASQTLTLPTGVVGMEFDVYNIDSSDSVTVARAGSDTIASSGVSITSVVIPAGCRTYFRCIAANTWVAVQESILSSTGSVNIGSTTPTAACSVSVGPGRWQIHAKGYADVSTTTARTTTVDIANTTTGPTVLDTENIYPAVTVAQSPFALQADVTVTVTSTISLRGSVNVVDGTQLMQQGRIMARAV